MLRQIRHSFLIFLLTITSLTISAEAMYRSTQQQSCEILDVNKDTPIYQSKYKKPEVIQQDIKTIQQRHKLTLDKAKGVLGEQAAREIVERRFIQQAPFMSQPYISIVTLFINKGCRIQSEFRDNADHGLDDVFVIPSRNGWIDPSYRPIFHEAKFNSKCQLKLNETKTICTQLSSTWINYHLDNAHERASLKICLPDKIMNVEVPCEACTEEFKKSINWLKERFSSGYFYRTASLLCPTGDISFYIVEGEMERLTASFSQQRISYNSSTLPLQRNVSLSQVSLKLTSTGTINPRPTNLNASNLNQARTGFITGSQLAIQGKNMNNSSSRTPIPVDKEESSNIASYQTNISTPNISSFLTYLSTRHSLQTISERMNAKVNLDSASNRPAKVDPSTWPSKKTVKAYLDPNHASSYEELRTYFWEKLKAAFGDDFRAYMKSEN